MRRSRFCRRQKLQEETYWHSSLAIVCHTVYLLFSFDSISVEETTQSSYIFWSNNSLSFWMFKPLFFRNSDGWPSYTISTSRPLKSALQICYSKPTLRMSWKVYSLHFVNLSWKGTIVAWKMYRKHFGSIVGQAQWLMRCWEFLFEEIFGHIQKYLSAFILNEWNKEK